MGVSAREVNSGRAPGTVPMKGKEHHQDRAEGDKELPGRLQGRLQWIDPCLDPQRNDYPHKAATAPKVKDDLHIATVTQKPSEVRHLPGTE